MKRREPGVRKAGGELIKTNLNYGSKDDVRDVYIFFSLGLGILEQPRTVPTTPGRLLFGSELLEIPSLLQIETKQKVYTVWGNSKFHTNQYFGSVEAVSLAVLAFTRKKKRGRSFPIWAGWVVSPNEKIGQTVHTRATRDRKLARSRGSLTMKQLLRVIVL